jgi:hypothetical protein
VQQSIKVAKFTKRNIMKVIILTFIIIFLSSCSEDSTNPEQEKNDLSGYFPLKIGNSWTYEMQNMGEWAILQRAIIDTIRDKDNILFYKSIFGVINYPPDSYSFEYYCWDNSGLYKYSCGVEDTCQDNSGNIYPAYQQLYIKSSVYEGEEWNRGPEWLTSDNMIEYNLVEKLHVKNQIHSYSIDTLFTNVALLSRTTLQDKDTLKAFEFYAPNFGLIKQLTIQGNDTLYKLNLLDYHLE